VALTLYYHPLASYCWKALIALYQHGVHFTPKIVNLMDERSRAEFVALWPMARFPVLHDEERCRTLPESSVLIEYLEEHYPRASAAAAT
jgi:glutathione S-transferase